MFSIWIFLPCDYLELFSCFSQLPFNFHFIFPVLLSSRLVVIYCQTTCLTHFVNFAKHIKVKFCSCSNWAVLVCSVRIGLPVD